MNPDPMSMPAMSPADLIAQSTPPRAPKPPAKKKSSEGPTFTKPENFTPPADATPDQEFQALGTFKMSADGEMTLVAIDGSKIGDKEPDASAANEPAEGEPAEQLPAA